MDVQKWMADERTLIQLWLYVDIGQITNHIKTTNCNEHTIVNKILINEVIMYDCDRYVILHGKERDRCFYYCYRLKLL